MDADFSQLVNDRYLLARGVESWKLQGRNTDERLAAAIPGARMVELPAANHLTAIVHPKLKEVVPEFLSKR